MGVEIIKIGPTVAKLKTDFPLKLTMHKFQRKQQCFAALLSAMSADLPVELTCFLFSFSSSLKKLIL